MAALATIVSCTQELELVPDSKGLVDIESVSMIAHNFSFEDTPTKTQISPSAQGMTFSWSSNDVVGVFPNNGKGTQVKFPIADGDVQGGSNTSNANFTGNGWAVMKAEDYSSYYPFVPDMDLDMTSIPVTYLNQVQIGSGTTGHLTSYDYMVTAPTPPSNNGEIAFDFQHMGVILQLEMVVPKPAEYTTLTLSCEGKPFISSGTIDITKSTPAITANAWTDEFEIQLENFVTTEHNQTIVVNLIMAPDDFSGKQIKVKLQGPHASFVTHFNRAEGKPYLPGSASHPTLGELQGGGITKLEAGARFNADIKTLANGMDYTYEQEDNRIQRIVFVAESNNHSNGDIIVSDQESDDDIYAHWDESTRTITITSNSQKVFAGEDASQMFSNLTALTSIDMTSFSTEYTTNMTGMFKGCSMLTSLDVSGLDVSKAEGFRFLFEGCLSLDGISGLNAWNTKNVTDMWNTFSGCSSLTSLDLSGWDVSNVGTFSGTFAGCRELATMTRDEWNTSNCTDFSHMFEGCSSLTAIEISDFITTKAESMGYMFMGCSSVTALDVSGFNTSRCTYFNNMFSGCTLLEDINLSDFDTSSALSMGAMFAFCSSLESIDISNFSTSKCTDFSLMFRSCDNLESIEGLYNIDTRKAITLEGMFQLCTNLASIDVSGFITNNVQKFEAMFEGCESVTAIDVSRFNTSRAESFESMFSGCTSLQSIDVSNFVTTNATKLNGMFGRCPSLTSIDVSSFNTSNVTNYSGMFSGCAGLREIDLSGFNFSKATDMGGLFQACTNLETIELPTQVNTAMVESMAYMFNGCSSLTVLDLSQLSTANVGSFEEMFSDCSALESLDISSFNTEVSLRPGKAGQENMFDGCTQMTSLTLGAGFQTVANAKGSIGTSAAMTINCPSSVKAHLLSVWGDSNLITWNIE